MQPKPKRRLQRLIIWLVKLTIVLALVYALLKQFGYGEVAEGVLNWVFEAFLPYAINSGLFTHPITLLVIALIVVVQVQRWRGDDQ